MGISGVKPSRFLHNRLKSGLWSDRLEVCVRPASWASVGSPNPAALAPLKFPGRLFLTDAPDDTRDPTKDGAGDISPISITTEMKKSYLDYAMSVIVSRALPGRARRPEAGPPPHPLRRPSKAATPHDKAIRKSANIVGDVIGRYHPHGDQSIYDALVRMAQPFSMSVPLIEGQGNFGSIDGDPPAAMRYTESRMTRVAAMTCSTTSTKTRSISSRTTMARASEPTVLPARFPNLLVNGAGGIAVGMATNIPPHNLGEIIDAAIALIDNPAIDDVALLDIVPGPDFPTGGLIIGRAGSRNGLMTGRGSVIMRARTHIEKPKGGREAIIVHRNSLPGEQGRQWSRRSPSWCATRRSKASPTCATKATATASVWSSRSSATPLPISC